MTVLGEATTVVDSVAPRRATTVEPAPGPAAGAPGDGRGARPSAGSSARARATRAATPTSASSPAPTRRWAWLDGFLSVDELRRLLPETAGLDVERHRLANLRARSTSWCAGSWRRASRPRRARTPRPRASASGCAPEWSTCRRAAGVAVSAADAVRADLAAEHASLNALARRTRRRRLGAAHARARLERRRRGRPPGVLRPRRDARDRRPRRLRRVGQRPRRRRDRRGPRRGHAGARARDGPLRAACATGASRRRPLAAAAAHAQRPARPLVRAGHVVASFLGARVMETWAHATDVADALGVERTRRPPPVARRAPGRGHARLELRRARRRRARGPSARVAHRAVGGDLGVRRRGRRRRRHRAGARLLPGRHPAPPPRRHRPHRAASSAATGWSAPSASPAGPRSARRHGGRVPGVEVGVAGPVATITLADVESRNVLSSGLVDALTAAIERCRVRPRRCASSSSRTPGGPSAPAPTSRARRARVAVDLAGLFTRVQRSALSPSSGASPATASPAASGWPR